MLAGRDREIARLRRMVQTSGDHGFVAVVRGPIGSGKSALVADLDTWAAAAGVEVRRTGGAAAAQLPPYAALHQLVGAMASELPATSPLREAFRFGAESPPPAYAVALAVLDVLRSGLGVRRGLLIVDNLDRIDVASRQVVTLLADRMSELPALLVLTTSEEQADGLVDGSFESLRLDPLDDSAARRVVRWLSPELTCEQRQWVVREAAGNPLAIRTLAAAVVGHAVDGPGSRVYGLTAPGVDLDGLPAPTREMLLLVALEPQLPVSGLPSPDVLATAVQRGVCDVCDDRVRFRHPLTGAVLRQQVRPDQLQRAHSVLAALTALPAPQRACHRALAVADPDAALGRELAEVAVVALHRDEADLALDALELAARHALDPALRVDRLIAAVTLAVDLGFTARAGRLLRWAADSGLGPVERSVVVTYGELLGARGARGERVAQGALDVLSRLEGACETRELFSPLLFRTLYRTRLEPGTRTELARGVSAGFGDGILRQALLVHADPIEHGPAFVEIARRIAPADVPDPRLLHMVASAASAVWAPDLASPLARAASQRLRAARMWGLLAESLTAEASIALRLGNVREAAIRLHDADELAGSEVLSVGPALAATRAAVEAQFVSETKALATIDAVRGQIIGSVVDPVLAVVELANGRVLLSGDRFQEAYDSFWRVHDPSDPAYHEYLAGWAIADLVESAVLAGVDLAPIRPVVDRWERIAARLGTRELIGQVSLARALLAADDAAEELYNASIDRATGYQRARALLAHGMWLRRSRRVTEARRPLKEAADVLRALGQLRLVERADRELRAAGVPFDGGAQNPLPLTAQEDQIARLAADGMSNKQIGAMLSLSPRTVGSHLYRMFPKLGITARSQLRDILRAETR
ncbi:hypothetical protein AZH51_13580 [Branchiibius sp. NY16-3462-2]|nr:hypothetical protein AZH51_13580 [Branchiibius sp. NY16-3462-2]